MKKIITFFILGLNFLCFIRLSHADSDLDKIRREANYILACQYLVSGSPAYGAINDISGLPTWVVPRENGMAILGLILASEKLNDPLYLERAQICADYLVSIQESDGSWHDQYVYENPVLATGKSPTMAAEVMMAFYKLGYNSSRYQAMKKGAEYLMECQKLINKGGNDDGLICGGKGPDENYYTWRWSTDNSYGFQALKAAEAWAIAYGETSFANDCAQAAANIINGINIYLRDGNVWFLNIDQWGTPQANPDVPPAYATYPHWAKYAPQMLDLPVTGLNSSSVGQWIANTFRQSDGSCIGYWGVNEGYLRIEKYPGLSFEAALCWYDTGHAIYAQNTLSWAENSPLWQVTPDGNGLTGGWIDWIEVSPTPGRIEDWWFRFIDTSFYYIATLSGGYDFNSYWKLNLDLPWYANAAPYNSTGAATAQMILNYIRLGAGATTLTQNEIYAYAKNPGPYTGELNPDQIDKALGHFDPYDSLVSNWADRYDTLPGGNPYQGYNYTVDSYDPNADPEAQNKYMRDICHWMAYPVTKEDWWQDGELVARPNTPAALPIYGTYDHWVVAKGYAASLNPSPRPHENPWEAPNFIVFGFWLKDPLVSGIGEETYKTAAECASTYFLPLSTSDAYNGKYVQVAEPPLKLSEAKIEIPSPEASGLTIRESEVAALSVGVKKLQTKNKKRTWREMVEPHLLTDKKAVAAFEGAQMGKSILVHRLDNSGADYCLVPFEKKVRGRSYLTSAVLVLDAEKGYFKEASWTDKPQQFLPISKAEALLLLRRQLLNILRYNHGTKSKYFRLLQDLRYAKVELVWEPNKYSSSVYSPYWKIEVNGAACFVTQRGKVIVF